MTRCYSDRRAGKQAAVKLTRTQRRQFEKLAARIDKVIQADRFFERFSNRQHRVRLAAESVYETPRPDIMPVRQVQPGSRLRATVGLDADLLPLPDGDAVVHALFDVAVRREAVPRHLVCTLIAKYTIGSESDA